MNDKKHKIELTHRWITHFIIKHNICPFAKYTVDHQLIKIEVIQSQVLKEACISMAEHIFEMKEIAPDQLSNMFLIVDDKFSFEDLLDIINILDVFCSEADLSDEFQFVAFHPDFYFEDSDKNDSGNFVNRSPHPMIHVLRMDEVSAAIEKDPQLVNDVPQKNAVLLRGLGITSIIQAMNPDV